MRALRSPWLLVPTVAGLVVGLSGLTSAAAAPGSATLADTSNARGARSSAQGTATQVRRSSLKFGTCPAAAAAPPGVYCAALKVPLNYAHPHGKQITLEVSAIGDADAPRAMIVNPGGPGAAAIGTEQYVWSNLPEQVTSQDEVFSFDPRGVGASSPISCGDVTKAAAVGPVPYTPRDAADLRARMAAAKRVARDCATRAGRAMLATMNVETEARDMNRVREAVGADRVDYLGYSAGSTLGATFETLFPSHVGRFVLDGVVDPTVSDYASDYEQDAAFQTRTEQFFRWVAARNGTYHLGSSRHAVQKTWLRVRRELDRHPAGGKVGSADLDDLLGGAMYLASEWGTTARLVTDYLRGHPHSLELAAENVEQGQPDIGFLAYTCGDPGWPRSWSTWRRDTAHAARTAPLYAWLNTWSSAPCRYWPTHVTSLPRIGSVQVPPTLLLDGKYDPATPLIGARRMQARLSGSRLVVTGGGDHASYLTDPNRCQDSIVEHYWLTGDLPAEDVTCPVSEHDVGRG